MATQEQLINKVMNTSVYTAQEREEWADKIKKGDKKAIRAATMLLQGKSPSEQQADINNYKEVGNHIVKVQSSPIHQKAQAPVHSSSHIKELQTPPAPKGMSTSPSPTFLIDETRSDIITPSLKQQIANTPHDPLISQGQDMIALTLISQVPELEQQQKELKQQQQAIAKAKQNLQQNKNHMSQQQYQQQLKQIQAQEQIIKQNQAIINKNKQIIQQNLNKGKEAIDLGIHRYNYYKHHYGSGNDAKDMAIAGGSGALIGGAIAGILAGPEAIPIGMAIGGVSNEAGEAAGKVVAYKTGNQEYAELADIGTSLITSAGLSVGATALAKATTTINNEVKAITKIGSPTQTLAKVDSTIEYKALGGMLRKTSKAQSIIKINTNPEQYIISKQGKDITVLTKSDDAYKSTTISKTIVGKKTYYRMSNYIINNEIKAVKPTLEPVYKPGQQLEDTYHILGTYKSTTAQGSKIIKAQGQQALKMTLFNPEGDTQIGIGRSVLTNKNIITKSKIKQIFYTPQEKSPLIQPVNKALSSSSGKATPKLIELQESKTLTVQDQAAVSTTLNKEVQSINQQLLTKTTPKLLSGSVGTTISLTKTKPKSKQNIQQLQSISITIQKGKQAKKQATATKTQTLSKTKSKTTSINTQIITAKPTPISTQKPSTNTLQLQKTTAITKTKELTKVKQITKEKLITKQTLKIQSAPVSPLPEPSNISFKGMIMPSISGGGSTRKIRIRPRQRQKSNYDFSPRFSWADINIIGKPLKPKNTKSNKKKDKITLYSSGGITHMRVNKAKNMLRRLRL